MKKKFLALSMVLGLSLMMVGCKNNSTPSTSDSADVSTSTDDSSSSDSTSGEGESEIINASSVDLTPYITLGEYKGLKVEKVTAEEVTEAEVEAQITSALAGQKKIESGTVEDGNTVNIDFDGYMNGEKVDSTCGTDYNLSIGSGSFIPGFEDGLIGAEVGEEVTLNLQFPDPYENNTDFSGKDVTFNVTINYLKGDLEMTDENVAQISDYETVEEYKAAIRTNLEQTAESEAQTTQRNKIWETALANATISEYPEEMVNSFKAQIKQSYASYASMYGVEVDDLLAQMGYTEDKLTEDAKVTLSSEMLAQAITKAENIEVTDEEYEEAMSVYYGEEASFTTLEELEAAYGAEDLRYNVLCNKTFDFVIDSAIIE